MRRLVRVQHYRCGEWHGDTYALSPDDASDSRIETDVRKAFDHYMQAKQEFNKQQQRPNWPGERLADYPNDLTVKEAKELYERRRVEHAEWLDRKRSVERSFGAWLFELDYVPLHDADAVEVYLSWGHQHNEELNMSLSDTDCSPKENIADTPRIKFKPIEL